MSGTHIRCLRRTCLRLLPNVRHSGTGSYAMSGTHILKPVLSEAEPRAGGGREAEGGGTWGGAAS
eukprot:1352465-Rhodomonas_salina.3